MEQSSRNATFESRWDFAYHTLITRLMDAAREGGQAAFALLKGCWERDDECLTFLTEQTNRLMAGLAA